MRLLCINGGLRGAHGDTAAALAHVARAARLHEDVDVDTLVLAALRADSDRVDDVIARVRAADALVLGTGTVWSGPSSVITRFLEVLTPYELSDVLLGKPAGVVVTMDSVGGLEAGARLVSALVLMGCTIPPCGLVALSRAAHAHPDVWSTDDLAVLTDNVLRAARARTAYRAWPVGHAAALTGGYPAVGALELGLPRALPDHD